MRLIDADALKETIAKNVYLVADFFNSRDYGMFWTGGIEKAIDEQPTIKPERKKGKWIDGKLDWHGIAMERYCSECGQLLTSAKTVHMNFCPNCGADII